MTTIPQDTPQDKPTPETTFIYALIDPETNEVRYVGKANDPQKRYTEHCQGTKQKDDRTYKSRWVQGLTSRGLKPILQVVEEVPYEQWEARECYWIDFYRAQGSPLTNTAKGGRGGKGLTSPEIGARISAAKKGKKNKPMSEEGRRTHRILSTGRKHTLEARAKIAAFHTGRKASPETLVKLSESHKGQVSAMKGRNQTPEARAKMSVAKRKKRGPMPEEQKRKIRESNRGQTRSPETRARLSASHMGKPSPKKGRKMSPESRAKMSLAKKQMYAMRKNPPDAPTLWDHAV